MIADAASPVGKTPSSPLVYIVDDDEAVRDSLMLGMEAEGCRVEGYASGPAFLAVVDPSRAGSLVLDLHMPGNGGFAVIDALAERGLRMPIVLISGRIDAASSARARAAGVRAVLEKPVDCRKLLDALAG